MPEEASDLDTSHACPDGSIVEERTPRGAAFRPSRGRASRTARALLAFAVAFPIVLAVVALLPEPAWVTSVGALMSLVVFVVIVSGSLAIGAAQCRSSAVPPLVGEQTGRVSYGLQVLLDVGASARLYIEERWHDGEGRPW